MIEGNSLKRVNIGCGQNPTAGWLNFDNSISVRLARFPLLAGLLQALRLVAPHQREFILLARSRRVGWADATRRIPLGDACASAIYSSHMLEHLDREQARQFLAEALRVLAPGGVIRLSVPDLKLLAARYAALGDADRFLEGMMIGSHRPRGLLERIRFLVVGERRHMWMYDGASLCRLLQASGFSDAHVCAAGSTRIADPGELDLFERADESVYAEAVK